MKTQIETPEWYQIGPDGCGTITEAYEIGNSGCLIRTTGRGDEGYITAISMIFVPNVVVRNINGETYLVDRKAKCS